MSSPTQPDPSPSQIPTIDTQISLTASHAYWSSITPTNDGMLGGYEYVTTPDLKHSKRFITQVRRILQSSSTSSLNQSSNSSTMSSKKISRAVDCGAGIGRITRGLLVKVADTVDVVEPIEKFADEVVKFKSKSEGVSSSDGQVGDVFVQGLESWEPPADRRYELIWNQWCLGHLTDAQLVNYLRRAAKALTGVGTEAGQEEKGWIMVKENLSKEEDGDIFDAEDSSVTRTDRNFRRIFGEAGLNIVKAGRQENFPSELYTVMMYALRPS